MSSPYWHGLPPFVEFLKVEVPWRLHGSLDYNPLMFMHQRLFEKPDPRSIICWNDPKATHAWWDGSCLCTALVKEGPKAMVVYGK